MEVQQENMGVHKTIAIVLIEYFMG